jgi:hypothetical protein
VKQVLLFVIAALALGLIGLLGVWSGMVWLFPSLGPTVALQAGSPEQSSAMPKNVVAGHLIGLTAGLLAVYLTGAVDVPAVTVINKLELARVAAAVLAVILSMSVQHLCMMRHPPAEATTLLIALGALDPTMRGASSVVVGVILVATLGEVIRRISLRLSHKPEQ